MEKKHTAVGVKTAAKRKPSLDEELGKLAKGIKNAKNTVMSDVRAVRERDPAARSDAEVLLLYPGVHALMAYRLSHALHQRKKYFAARAISQTARLLTGIEIHPGAKIGKGLVIDHGMGVVIGETAEIGTNCTIYHQVTLGGTGKDTGKRHPTIGDNVLIGAGAKILGPVYIGDNARVASGSVVLTDIPANATAAGVPAIVVRKNGEKARPSDDLNQQDVPDYLGHELEEMRKRLEKLERESV